MKWRLVYPDAGLHKYKVQITKAESEDKGCLACFYPGDLTVFGARGDVDALLTPFGGSQG